MSAPSITRAAQAAASAPVVEDGVIPASVATFATQAARLSDAGRVWEARAAYLVALRFPGRATNKSGPFNISKAWETARDQGLTHLSRQQWGRLVEAGAALIYLAKQEAAAVGETVSLAESFSRTPTPEDAGVVRTVLRIAYAAPTPRQDKGAQDKGEDTSAQGESQAGLPAGPGESVPLPEPGEVSAGQEILRVLMTYRHAVKRDAIVVTPDEASAIREAMDALEADLHAQQTRMAKREADRQTQAA